jgi:hypothetical protein
VEAEKALEGETTIGNDPAQIKALIAKHKVRIKNAQRHRSV